MTRLTIRVDSTTRLTRLQPVDFCFFFILKQRRFDFKKKRIDPDDSVTQSKSGIQALDRAGHQAGKNYGFDLNHKTFFCQNL